MEREDNIVTCSRIQYNSRDEVTRNARNVNRKVHFASFMVLCHLKHTEFNTHHQTYQGHVVLNETSSSLTKQGASASRAVAATVFKCKIAGNGGDMTAMLVCRSGLWFSVARFCSARPSRAKTQCGQDRFSTLAFWPFVFDLPSLLFIGPPLDFIFQEYLLSLSPDRQHFRCFCLFFAQQIWAIHGPFGKSTSRSWYIPVVPTHSCGFAFGEVAGRNHGRPFCVFCFVTPLEVLEARHDAISITCSKLA